MKNYLSLILILALLPFALRAQETPPPQDPQPPETEQPAPEEKKEEEPKQEEKQPSPDDVIKEMEGVRKERDAQAPAPTPAPDPTEPTKPALDANEKPQPVEPIRPKELDPRSQRRASVGGYREGDPIVARTGRMLRTSEGTSMWMLSFDSDSSGLRDTPLFLIPCRELEKMEAAMPGNTDGARFTVTGEVFLYHGKAYLLPRITRPAADMGNLNR